MPDAKPVKLRYAAKDAEYYPFYCGFDIETTNYIEGDKKLGFMYHWQFIISDMKYCRVFTGRTWGAFFNFIQELQEHYKLSYEKRIVIADANLGFEFQFIRRYFDFENDDFFARELRHPMKCRSGGLEFHEVLTISGGSLAQLAKDYTVTQKLKGDLDYKVMRNSKTPLTGQELDYCINDVVILGEYMKYLWDAYILPDQRIPLTKTGILRAECRKAGQDLLGYNGMKEYRSLIYEAYPDEKTYEIWFKYLFRGGYVHANVLMAGFTLFDVDGDDFTSSYPYQMACSDEYPMTPFVLTNFDKELLDTKACILHVRFYGVRRRWAHSLESKSKCVALEGSKITPVIIDNGRVAQAQMMEVYITNVDYELYRLYYDIDSMEVLEFWTAERGRLPIFIRKTLNKYYKQKAELKQRLKNGEDVAAELAIVKQKVNSFFGMMVTRIELNKVVYEDDEWDFAEKALEFDEEIKSQFLLPQWGIWVTALARRALMKTCALITQEIGDGSGEDGAGVIYNDTDSLKFYDPKGKAQKIIDAYNKKVDEALKASKLTAPEFADLGKFDHEKGYPVKRFKTLGGKRYLTEKADGIIEATIAGLPKQSILKIDGDPFEAFNFDGMEIEADAEIKNTISYNSDLPADACIDGEWMHEESCACIYNIGFTLSLDKAYYMMVVDAIEERIHKYGD